MNNDLQLILRSMNWNGGFDVASNTGEIETHFTYSETRLKHKLNGSTLVGVNVKKVLLNEG